MKYIMKCTFYIIFLSFLVLINFKHTMALNMTDFIPDFLLPSSNTDDSDIENKKLINQRASTRNQESESSRGCQDGELVSGKSDVRAINNICITTSSHASGKVASLASSANYTTANKLEVKDSSTNIVKESLKDIGIRIDGSSVNSNNVGQKSDMNISTGDVKISANSNQTAFQDQAMKNVLAKYDNDTAFSLPLQPTKDVKMNVNQQQIQFKINY